MFWHKVDFNKLVQLLLPTFLRKQKQVAFLGAMVKPLQDLHTLTLYEMQHDGRTIYLEKMLNEHFEVAGYDPTNHDATKKIYIEDVAELDYLYIWQDEELDVCFLEDDDSDLDIFLDNETEGIALFSWVIFIPGTYVFREENIRALVDEYRYFGKKYRIEIAP